MTGGSCGEVVRSILRSHCDGSETDIDYVELFLDFENAVPRDDERYLFDLSEKIINQCTEVLSDVKSYGKGATEEIRQSLQNPHDLSLRDVTVNVVEDCVARIRCYFELSLRIEKLVPELLWDLCSGPLPPEDQLDRKQSLARQFARLIDFILDFDAVKMCTPALQNDFSHYRRSIGLGLLGTTATVCRYMVESPDVSSRMTETTRLFCVRVMVGCLILYDHIDDNGAFVRESPINLRAVVNVVREQTQPPQTDALLNAIRYTSKHFSQPTTPKSIRAILA
ncbi:hypothetical protein NECAME_08965 [Necator americanus]|uniref:CYRIA/CYRIB Rac1 binding domain-containing protein n=1 Tax=Necator americanus TaxID=51031 RepID=W2TGR5_NECAM|nr:hypothetical protein NECAME_08965 [Necator americanus]ETN80759.1 hypothetical protein NECAME_08965 [Necator americanus]